MEKEHTVVEKQGRHQNAWVKRNILAWQLKDNKGKPRGGGLQNVQCY